MIFTDNAKHFYQTAQICKNGHLRNADANTHSAKNEMFCSICGAEVISACTNCNSPIRGAYYISKPIYSSSLSHSHIKEFKNLKISSSVEVPAYCYKCGAPYPWTESCLQTAENIINMIDELTDVQKAQLIEFIPDIIVETPKSRYAALIYAKFMDGLSGLVYENFVAWAKENVLPTLLILMNMQK